jgi:hypothetical protein
LLQITIKLRHRLVVLRQREPVGCPLFNSGNGKFIQLNLDPTAAVGEKLLKIGDGSPTIKLCDKIQNIC